MNETDFGTKNEGERGDGEWKGRWRERTGRIPYIVFFVYCSSRSRYAKPSSLDTVKKTMINILKYMKANLISRTY